MGNDHQDKILFLIPVARPAIQLEQTQNIIMLLFRNTLLLIFNFKDDTITYTRS